MRLAFKNIFPCGAGLGLSERCGCARINCASSHPHVHPGAAEADVLFDVSSGTDKSRN